MSNETFNKNSNNNHHHHHTDPRRTHNTHSNNQHHNHYRDHHHQNNPNSNHPNPQSSQSHYAAHVTSTHHASSHHASHHTTTSFSSTAHATQHANTSNSSKTPPLSFVDHSFFTTLGQDGIIKFWTTEFLKVQTNLNLHHQQQFIPSHLSSNQEYDKYYEHQIHSKSYNFLKITEYTKHVTGRVATFGRWPFL